MAFLQSGTWTRKHWIALFSLSFSMLLATFGYYFYQVFFSDNLLIYKKQGPPKQAQQFIIDQDTSFDALSASLLKTGIIEDPISFGFVARLLRYDKHMKRGAYLFEPGMSNLEAIHMLLSGKENAMRVRFHGLRKLNELPLVLSHQLGLDTAHLSNLLANDSVAASYGFDLDSFALMFIPNTYQLYWSVNSQDFLLRMKKEYDRFWNEKRRAQAKKLNLNPIQVGILASIVQAETNKEDEKARVAGVYLNRLAKGMRLEADPTLVFAWDDFSIRRVLYKHKRIHSPYNTYAHAGVPPGPINLPEPSSIDSVLYGKAHEYFFFCAKADFSGYHVFSKTYDEHKRYARAFQRRLNQEQRKSKRRKNKKSIKRRSAS